MSSTMLRRGFTAPVNLLLIALVFYALGTYMYATLRFAGRWNENDTTVLTRSIYFVERDETVLDVSIPYGNGLSYQAISVFLLQTTGVDVQTLQLYVMPFVAALLPVMAFVTYRELTQNNLTGLLACLILYLQPDFLFVTWRGSHEKITWTLTLFLLFLLARSFTAHASTGALQRYVVLFYITAFAFVCSNAFFATSLTAAIALSFLVGSLLIALRNRFGRNTEKAAAHQIYRLVFVTMAVGVLVYLFFFYIYPPAISLLLAFKSLYEGLAALFLETEQATNPYDYVTAAWIDPRIYLLLTGISMVIVLMSFFVWLRGIPRFIRTRDLSKSDLARLYLWLVYPTFAFQLALSLVADRTAAIGSNLQVRLFTPLMLTAVPLVAIGVSDIMVWLSRRKRRFLRNGLLLGGAAVIPAFSIFAMFKVTNEPVVSNNWLFSTSAEREAAMWSLLHSDDPISWMGIDDRFRAGVVFDEPEFSYEDTMTVGVTPRLSPRYFVISDIERARWLRQSLPLPFLDDDYRVYDNGLAQVYYRRQLTDYQR